MLSLGDVLGCGGWESGIIVNCIGISLLSFVWEEAGKRTKLIGRLHHHVAALDGCGFSSLLCNGLFLSSYGFLLPMNGTVSYLHERLLLK